MKFYQCIMTLTTCCCCWIVEVIQSLPSFRFAISEWFRILINFFTEPSVEKEVKRHYNMFTTTTHVSKLWMMVPPNTTSMAPEFLALNASTNLASSKVAPPIIKITTWQRQLVGRILRSPTIINSPCEECQKLKLISLRQRGNLWPITSLWRDFPVAVLTKVNGAVRGQVQWNPCKQAC